MCGFENVDHANVYFLLVQIEGRLIRPNLHIMQIGKKNILKNGLPPTGLKFGAIKYNNSHHMKIKFLLVCANECGHVVILYENITEYQFIVRRHSDR